MDAAEEARSSVFIDGTSAAKQRLQQLLHLAGQSYFLAAQCPGLDLQGFTMFHHVSPAGMSVSPANIGVFTWFYMVLAAYS